MDENGQNEENSVLQDKTSSVQSFTTAESKQGGTRIPLGRPTKYRETFTAEADAYLATTGKEQMHLPKIESFALWLDVNEDTLVEWGKKYPDFSAALDKIKKRQKEQLIDDGIYGGNQVNATIVKLLLQNNHGMREKNDTDLTSKGEKIETNTIVLSNFKHATEGK